MKREIKLFCSSNVASVFLKPIILHGIYALNLEKRREKNVSFFEKGAGGYFKLCFVGRDSGGEGGYFTPRRGSKRHSHHLIELRLSDLNLINNTVQVFFKENLTESFISLTIFFFFC